MPGIAESSAVDHARLRQSKWPYWSVIPIWAWVSWLHLAILTREIRYFVLAILYAIPFAFLIAMPELLAPGREDGSAMLMGTYFGGLIHVWTHRRKFSVTLADMSVLAGAPVSTVGPTSPVPAPAASPAIAVPVTPSVAADRSNELVKESFRDIVLKQKIGIQKEENWSSAGIIPIVPCNEDADSASEVATAWKRPSAVGRTLRPFNFFYERRFYSAISVFGDRFYVTQTSHWIGLFGVLFTPRRVEVVREHSVSDVLKLVVTRRRNERFVYSAIYESYDSRKASDEVFHLYVRVAPPGAAPDSNTIVKYVFSVANDVGSSPISLEQALATLHHLVPAEKRSVTPFTAGHTQRLTKQVEQKIRNKLRMACLCFGFAGLFAAASVGQAAIGEPTDDIVPPALLSVFLTVLGLWLMRSRRGLQLELKTVSQRSA